MTERGYEANFLGPNFRVPLPTFSNDLRKNVYEYENELYTRYIHFSIATNQARRQPIVAALNIDQNKIMKVGGRRNWIEDPKVGEFQLGPRYYKNNPIDRGHLARRAVAAWGDTIAEAQAASDATNIYSNCSLQHARFNQDEWLALEDWVWRLNLDGTNKICVFSGPIYTSKSGIRCVIGDPLAFIPTAFFKVVCFVDKSNKLATRAFIVPQDYDALSPKNARKNLDLATYQVPCRLIEEETGLRFDEAVKDANPMRYDGDIPQILPVDEEDIRNEPGPSVEESPYEGVYLQTALINPEGEDAGNEKITLINLTSNDIELQGWTIKQDKKQVTLTSGVIMAGEARTLTDIRDLRLRNKGGTITLLDNKSRVVHRVSYTRSQSRPGVSVMFPRIDT